MTSDELRKKIVAYMTRHVGASSSISELDDYDFGVLADDAVAVARPIIRAEALEEAAMRCEMEANSHLEPMNPEAEAVHRETALRIAASIRATLESK